MTPARVLWALAVLAFLPSCFCFRAGREVAGYRLLYLASGLLLCCCFAMFERWGLFP